MAQCLLHPIWSTARVEHVFIAIHTLARACHFKTRGDVRAGYHSPVALPATLLVGVMSDRRRRSQGSLVQQFANVATGLMKDDNHSNVLCTSTARPVSFSRACDARSILRRSELHERRCSVEQCDKQTQAQPRLSSLQISTTRAKPSRCCCRHRHYSRTYNRYTTSQVCFECRARSCCCECRGSTTGRCWQADH